jgi:hypothetical protein
LEFLFFGFEHYKQSRVCFLPQLAQASIRTKVLLPVQWPSKKVNLFLSDWVSYCPPNSSRILSLQAPEKVIQADIVLFRSVYRGVKDFVRSKQNYTLQAKILMQIACPYNLHTNNSVRHKNTFPSSFFAFVEIRRYGIIFHQE